MIICFKEKHEDRFVEGDSREDICAQVLRERIDETYRVAIGGTCDRSIWYDDDTEFAQLALDNGNAVQYMSARRAFEYEDWFVVN